jgi:hypothetical protein
MRKLSLPLWQGCGFTFRIGPHGTAASPTLQWRNICLKHERSAGTTALPLSSLKPMALILFIFSLFLKIKTVYAKQPINKKGTKNDNIGYGYYAQLHAPGKGLPGFPLTGTGSFFLIFSLLSLSPLRLSFQ